MDLMRPGSLSPFACLFFSRIFDTQPPLSRALHVPSYGLVSYPSCLSLPVPYGKIDLSPMYIYMARFISSLPPKA